MNDARLIPILLFISRRAGYLIGVFSRLQTRVLSAAQFRGWQPETEEAQTRVARRQFQLFEFNQARAAIRKLKKAGAK